MNKCGGKFKWVSLQLEQRLETPALKGVNGGGLNQTT